MDYQTIESGAISPRIYTVLARATNAPIVSGTVNWYLKCLVGANAGKWWKDSDQTWAAIETANAMTHIVDGHWGYTFTSSTSPYVSGYTVLEYLKESGDLHIPVSKTLYCGIDTLDTIIEGTYTVRELLRVMSAALAGKVSGAETRVPTFRNISDTKAVIIANTDNYGNRSAVVIDAT
jgi:hypothetical protein